MLEASARAGGLVHTLRGGAAGELSVETGPEALTESNAETSALLAELDLEPRALAPAARKRYLALDGRLHAVPSSPLDVLTSPLLSFAGKARALAEVRRDPRRALDGSIADFVRHRFGREVLERFVDPLVSGIFAGDPEQLSLRACFPEAARLLEQHESLIAAAARDARPAARRV